MPKIGVSQKKSVGDDDDDELFENLNESIDTKSNNNISIIKQSNKTT